MNKKPFTILEEDLTDLYSDWEGSKHFEGTAERVHKMFEEFCWPLPTIKEELDKCFEAVFKDSYNEMLIEGPIKVWTLCPHHLVPVTLKVYIGYLPNGEVLGLSKFSRIATILSKRPIIQEQYTRELADIIDKNLNPKGVGIWVVGSHGCMTCRGVLQDAEVSTSVLRGSFLEEGPTRQEFYDIVKSMR